MNLNIGYNSNSSTNSANTPAAPTSISNGGYNNNNGGGGAHGNNNNTHDGTINTANNNGTYQGMNSYTNSLSGSSCPFEAARMADWIQAYCNSSKMQGDPIDFNMHHILRFEINTENSFFKSIIVAHFKHILLDDYIDIYNLSLFDMFERVKNKRFVLKVPPINSLQCTEEQLNESFCTQIYNLI